MATFAGQTIAERYRLENVIGEGATATVWRAVHTQLERPVAVKFIHAEGRDGSLVGERFLREARLAAAIRHRMVVDILDFGTTPGGQPFMVMEFLEGIPLDERLVRSPKLGDGELLRILDLALSGLAAIHQAGIVHRDIKPANIFLVQDADGYFPKLLDFGISRAVDPQSAHLQSALTTKSGWLFGTPRYMAPEQARGLFDVDHRADLYSMGVIMYEALTGRLPFDATALGDLLIRVTKGGAAPVKEVRPELGPISDVIEKAMSVDREARWQSAREMRAALREALDATNLVRPSLRPDSDVVVLPAPSPDSLELRPSKVPTAELDLSEVERTHLADTRAAPTPPSGHRPKTGAVPPPPPRAAGVQGTGVASLATRFRRAPVWAAAGLAALAVLAGLAFVVARGAGRGDGSTTAGGMSTAPTAGASDAHAERAPTGALGPLAHADPAVPGAGPTRATDGTDGGAHPDDADAASLDTGSGADERSSTVDGGRATDGPGGRRGKRTGRGGATDPLFRTPGF